MCKFGYNMPAAAHKVPLGQNAIDYIKDISPVNMEISAHVKNEYAEVWAMNDFSNKIVDAMLKKKFVIFRIGKTIYEDVIITGHEPQITNIYDISFKLKLSYGYNLGRESRLNRDGLWTVNSGIRSRVFENLFGFSEYLGQGRVEKVYPWETTLIESAKKALGRDKITIDGQEL